jgi:FecR protein
MRLDPRSVFAMLSASAALALASLASAQEPAGVVTTIEGKVTVAHASSPAPIPLRFRDAVFVRDSIATGKDAFARVLLGGRAVVTIREFSAVTITEEPNVATVTVGSGRVAVAVARERMRPGDLVEVRTPNAVAGIRGTVIVAEVFGPQNSLITVLKGVIDVTRLDAGHPTGPATILSALEQVRIGTTVRAPQTISTEDARRMRDTFRTTPPRTVPLATTAAVTQAEMERVAREASQRPTATRDVARGQSGGTSDGGVDPTPTISPMVRSTKANADDDAAAPSAVTSVTSTSGSLTSSTLSSVNTLTGSTSSVTSGSSGSGVSGGGWSSGSNSGSGSWNNGNGWLYGTGWNNNRKKN